VYRKLAGRRDSSRRDPGTDQWYAEDGVTPLGTEIVRPYPTDGIILAEGNIGVRGTIAQGKRLTIVTLRTAYINGPLMRERDSQGRAYNNSAIAILARDHICVNTTQFVPVGGWKDTSTSELLSEPKPIKISTNDPSQQLTALFEYAGGALNPPAPGLNIFISHLSQGNRSGGGLDTTKFGFWVNSHQASGTNLGNLDFSGSNNYTYDLGATFPTVLHDVISLLPSGGGDGYTINTFPGSANTIKWGFANGAPDYLLQRFGIAPLTIDIEAALYAQKGSFYVLPGYWFNTNRNDTRAAFTSGDNQSRYGRNRPPEVLNELFPFYQEPIDVQIHIYGSISEGTPASEGDAMNWSRKWAWDGATARYGSTNYTFQQVSGHTRGIVVEYNPNQRYQLRSKSDKEVYRDPISELRTVMRFSDDGQVLPLMPRLPVSRGMLYYGQD
jgi:hypothetical protein